MASTNLSARPGTPAGNEISLGRIWQGGVLAIVGAVLANLLVRALVVGLMEVPTAFPPFQMGAIAFLNFMGVAAGVAVFAVISRISRRPLRTFQIVAVVALVISIIPNIALALNPGAAPVPGGTPTAFLVLILFHVVAGVVAIGVLTGYTRARR
jgi:hypothetical protein